MGLQASYDLEEARDSVGDSLDKDIKPYAA